MRLAYLLPASEARQLDRWVWRVQALLHSGLRAKKQKIYVRKEFKSQLKALTCVNKYSRGVLLQMQQQDIHQHLKSGTISN